MKIEVLGSGCPRCHTLEKHAKEAVKQLGIEAEIEHLTDLQHSIKRMQEVRAITTPALVVDGKLVLQGKVPSVPELVQTLASLMAAEG
ncbi:MAG: MTH895/ArsE family thioredoxin-like protein [Armatimonadota bacterium]|nr:MTH895/ArsE family thioredoxin-like protein [bacterium]MCS7310266.1 MTH895/ArsE family thioredoxin-like protein [Armatimonadota bacterium]MDW8103911.1 MTH895/ArsE family thioredoxin-like protein [Armatimonadota bacterium]MDW8289660.1 MTH895/ArsE family thioredoxin-like protein [Armatimonadota bacterium]